MDVDAGDQPRGRRFRRAELSLHWFPAKVTRQSLSWNYSFWLGTISFVLFLILVITGIPLMFLYVPSIERAYLSVKDIEFAVSFGWFLRGLHRISAHLMVAVVFLHMVRVFLSGAYRNGTAANQNRPLNWIIGIVLLLLTLLLSFTGYLLPWDQLAYWAITVGTNIAFLGADCGERMRFLLLGGNTIDQNTLIRFYVLHCFFLPLACFFFSHHMWRVRKDGGLACVDQLSLEQKKENAEPIKSKTYSLLGITSGRTVHVETSLVDEDKHTVASSPNLTAGWCWCLGTLAVSVLLTVLFRAPLEEANPAVTPNPAKAPWYFLWLQELVTLTTFTVGGVTINGALIGGIIVPGLLVLAAVLWPYLDKVARKLGRRVDGESQTQTEHCLLVIVAVIVILTVIGTYLRGPYWDLYWPWQSWPTMPRKF